MPGHSGIKGNKEADSATREALSVYLEIYTAPPLDLKVIFCSYVNNNWQTEWDLYTMNKLDEISPDVEKINFYQFCLTDGTKDAFPKSIVSLSWS